MKFVLLVEGETERKTIPKFLKRWLDSQLKQPIEILAVKFAGCSELVADSPDRARRYLESPKGDVIAVIALLDIFRLELKYPKSVKSIDQKSQWAKEHLETKVGQPKFRQFFAVYEIEAWLLSDHTIFPSEVRSDLTGKSERPETVNQNEPPAKLLDRLYRSKTGRNYKKVVNGQELFEKLDPTVAYAKCPNLKAMLDEMLTLAKEAGL